MKNYNLTPEEKEFVKEMIKFLSKKDCDAQLRYWCRRLDHPNGVVYYDMSLNATGPDMHCTDCGEDLG